MIRSSGNRAARAQGFGGVGAPAELPRFAAGASRSPCPEPEREGGGVYGPAVATSGEEWPGPVDLPDAGFDRPSLALGFSDALVGYCYLLIQIKHEYLRSGIVDCSADSRAG